MGMMLGKKEDGVQNYSTLITEENIRMTGDKCGAKEVTSVARVVNVRTDDANQVMPIKVKYFK